MPLLNKVLRNLLNEILQYCNEYCRIFKVHSRLARLKQTQIKYKFLDISSMFIKKNYFYILKHTFQSSQYFHTMQIHST